MVYDVWLMDDGSNVMVDGKWFKSDALAPILLMVGGSNVTLRL